MIKIVFSNRKKGLNSILESGDEHHQQIKQFVIGGIRKLAVYANQPENDEFKATMAKFAPNYLKTLLELYRTKVRQDFQKIHSLISIFIKKALLRAFL
jgi:hypothetical protein